MTWWLAFVKRFGGLYEVGPVMVGVVDDGLFLAVRRVIRWEWRL